MLFGVAYIKIPLNTRKSRFSLMSSSSSFMVLHFEFRSVIHFKLIFVKDTMALSRFFFFFFLRVDVRLFQHHLLKRLLCSIVFPCSFVKNQWTVFIWVSFWALYSVALIYLCILSLMSHCLNYGSFILS